MLSFLADECFSGTVLRALRRALPEVEFARVQDVGLSGADDPDLLEWAAHHGPLVLTRDESTLIGYAYERVDRREAMPGIVQVFRNASIGRITEDLVLIATCSMPDEWDKQVIYVPLR